MKRKGRHLSRVSENAPANQKKPCTRKVRALIAPKSEAPAVFNINSLPDLPFAALFGWLPLVDLLSAQLVSQQWMEMAIREAATHRDAITLCIDGEAENQKTARYLERTVWNLPHAEKLKTEDGRPLFPDYVPPCQRHTFWNTFLLGTRQENPILLDSTSERAQKHEQWKAEYDASFGASLDEKVSLLLALFPRGPRTLTIVCRSGHSDFLRLLPLLINWKDQLVTLELYSSHPRAFDYQIDTHLNNSHYLSSFINHTSNGPLLAALNCISSLLHLTLDILGQEGDTSTDSTFNFNLRGELEKSGVGNSFPDLIFLSRIQSFTFADRNSLLLVYAWIFVKNLANSLNAIQVGNSSFTTTDLTVFSAKEQLGPFVRHLHLHLSPYGGGNDQRNALAFASLTSLCLNLLNVERASLAVLLYYIRLPRQLRHLRLHLTGEQVTRWCSEMAAFLEDEQGPPLLRLPFLSLILLSNRQMDARLPSLLKRLFPYLQVILFTQRLIRPHQRKPAQFLEHYLASIRRHFSKALSSGAASFLLLEVRLYLYKDPNHLTLLQSKERTWTIEKLRATSFR